MTAQDMGAFVGQFSWMGPGEQPPEQWDLRRIGWHLREELTGFHPMLCGPDSLPSPSYRGRTLVIDVHESGQRARLISSGMADALSPDMTLEEVGLRASRLTINSAKMPRLLRIGKLLLDLFHRDAKYADKWLALRPREFELLWRLAEAGGRCVTRESLLRDVWRINHDPGTNRVEVHISRLRSRLAFFGQEDMVQTDTNGGYRLIGSGGFLFSQTPDAGPKEHILHEAR